MIRDDEIKTTIIENDGGDAMVLTYQYMDENALLEILTTEADYETVQVNGEPAEFYYGLSADETNFLFWTDEQTHIAFYLSSFLEKNEMLRIAENVVLTE